MFAQPSPIAILLSMAADDPRVVDCVHQPKKFTFPKRSFGTKGEKRAFNPAWFDKWSWIDYSGTSDHVTCFYCSRANRKNLLPDGFRVPTILRNGTEHLVPQNTYFVERIKMGPKQLPSLVVII